MQKYWADQKKRSLSNQSCRATMTNKMWVANSGSGGPNNYSLGNNAFKDRNLSDRSMQVLGPQNNAENISKNHKEWEEERQLRIAMKQSNVKFTLHNMLEKASGSPDRQTGRLTSKPMVAKSMKPKKDSVVDLTMRGVDQEAVMK